MRSNLESRSVTVQEPLDYRTPPRKTLFKALSGGGAVACSILHQRITSKDYQKPQTIPKTGRQKEVDAQHLESA